jgi:hypothetical protein
MKGKMIIAGALLASAPPDTAPGPKTFPETSCEPAHREADRKSCTFVLVD